MDTSGFSISELLGISLELVIRLVWISAVLAVGVWLWPEGVSATQLTEIGFGAALWAIGSVVLVAIGLAALYFAVVEPYVDVYLDYKRDDRDFPSGHR